MKAAQQMPTVSADKATQVALAALDGIQTMTPGEQVAGLFLLARVVSDRLGLDVSDLFNQAMRRERDGDTFYRREIKALRDYVDNQLK